MKPARPEDPRASEPVQTRVSLASLRMPRTAGDGRARRPAGGLATCDGDPVSDEDGFGADALPLRPPAERSEEREKEERLRLLTGARRRSLRLPAIPHAAVLTAAALGSAALVMLMLLSHPWSGRGRQPEAAARRHIEAPPAATRGDAPAVRRSTEPVPLARGADRHPPKRAGGHHERQGRRGKKRRARSPETSPAGPGAAPAAAVSTRAASPAAPEPEPVYEPPPTPAPEPDPAPQEGVATEPQQATSPPTNESASGQDPTAVEQRFGFER
jgi:hypothetical protein